MRGPRCRWDPQKCLYEWFIWIFERVYYEWGCIRMVLLEALMCGISLRWWWFRNRTVMLVYDKFLNWSRWFVFYFILQVASALVRASPKGSPKRKYHTPLHLLAVSGRRSARSNGAREGSEHVGPARRSPTRSPQQANAVAIAGVGPAAPLPSRPFARVATMGSGLTLWL